MGSVQDLPPPTSLSKHPSNSNPQFTFQSTRFCPSSFWARRRHVVRSTTLQTQLDMLRKTGRYDAFDLKWHPSYNDPPRVWPVPNHLFWDSDVAKWIEGACYFLMEEDDEEMKSVVEDLVMKIRKAQQPDGYLNIHFTVVEPEKRFTNLRDLHELYNAGHLIEAALIHHEYFKNNELLAPILRYVDLLYKIFGTRDGQIRGYPGHPEIELALLRLYQATGDLQSLELARYFIGERGNAKGVNGRHYYDVEAERRGDRENEMPSYYPSRRSYWYQQAHKPILEQESVEGHSVRAMYLLTSVADLSLIDKKSFGQKYEDTLRRLWSNMADRKMYLTGGIGAIEQWEGFGIDHFLPQGTDEGGCYSETCAAIGVMMLAERLLQMELNAKYADILELCLYNAVLTGMSLDGKAFTYVNQLASSASHPSKREEWFECACCPPNVSRVLGYLGGYLWTYAESGPKSASINVHLYSSATLSFQACGQEIKLMQTTDWPWSGDVEFEFTASHAVDVTIRLRIPQWADEFQISPQPPSQTPENGYLVLPPSYLEKHPKFSLSIPMRPRLISPHPFTNQPIAAVARGPIVYCVEDADHPWVDDHFKSVVFDTSVPLTERVANDLSKEEEYIAITAVDAARFLQLPKTDGPFASHGGAQLQVDPGRKESLRFIPYYARANRGGKGMMRVGLRVGGFTSASV